MYLLMILTGIIGERNLIQIKNTKSNTEWIGQEFKDTNFQC